MKYKFVSMGTGFVPVERDSFAKAFRDMYHWIKSQTEGLPLQILETAIWIECIDDAELLSLYFYDARDRAIELGILKDGKLVE